MKEEIAQRLKDAGFKSQCWDITTHVGARIDKLAPSLSELIKACGDGFAYLSVIKRIPGPDTWAASGWDEFETCLDKECCEDVTSEETPEEAVALLWLRLNKKK